MKILAIHADGLLVENAAAVPSTDPIMDAVMFVRQLIGDTPGAVLVTTASGNPDMMTHWLAQLGLKPTWMRGVPQDAVERVERTLSEVGKLGGRISYYITSSATAGLVMTGHGVPSIQYRSPTESLEYRPKPGGGRWGEVYEHVEEPGDDDDDDGYEGPLSGR